MYTMKSQVQVQRFGLQAGAHRVSLRTAEGGTMQIIGAGLTLEGGTEEHRKSFDNARSRDELRHVRILV